MCVASTLLFHGSARKYFTRVSVNPIIFKIKWGKKKKSRKAEACTSCSNWAWGSLRKVVAGLLSCRNTSALSHELWLRCGCWLSLLRSSVRAVVGTWCSFGTSLVVFLISLQPTPVLYWAEPGVTQDIWKSRGLYPLLVLDLKLELKTSSSTWEGALAPVLSVAVLGSSASSFWQGNSEPSRFL